MDNARLLDERLRRIIREISGRTGEKSERTCFKILESTSGSRWRSIPGGKPPGCS